MADGSVKRDQQRDLQAITVSMWAVVAVGVALRLVAYGRRSVFWLDEVATTRNILERSLRDLLVIPLDYGQAAPKGFLLLEWLVANTLGSGDLALRLVPFLASIASLFAVVAIARRLLSPAGALAAVLFFAVGYWPLAYTADVHPYGLDLALSLGALLLAIEVRRLGFTSRRVWALAAYGAGAVWFSNATVLTLFGLGVALGAVSWRDRGLAATLRVLWPIGAVTGASALGAVWVAKHSFFPVAAEYFDWLYRGGMVPAPRSVAAVRWLWDAWRGQLALWHGWAIDNPAWTSLYVCLALVGFLSLLRRRTADAMIAGSVIAAFVLVSMAKQYPYESRLLLAPIAVFLFGIGESIGVLADAAWERGRIAARALALLLCVPPIYQVAAYPPPYQWTVTGSYLAQIRARWQPGDVVYSTYGRAPEVLYNAPRFGFAASDVVLGPCDHEDHRATLRAADALRGRARAWVIVESGRYFPGSPEYAYLRTIGVRRDSLPVDLPGSVRISKPDAFDISTAYLFDLDDSTRLARASAETYAFSPLMERRLARMNRWSCYGVWSPLVRESENRGDGRRE